MNEPTREVLRRRLVAAAIIVAGLALCFVAAFYGQRALLRGQVASESAQARAEALPVGDQAHAAWRAMVAPALGLPGEPVWSVAYDMCWTEHSGSGWMISGWNSNCMANRIDLYTIPADIPALDSLVRQAQWHGAGESESLSTSEYMAAAGIDADPDRPEWMPDTVWVTPPGVMDARIAADQRIVADRMRLSEGERAFKDRTLLAESGRPDLDPYTPYLMISDPQIYYQRELGCAIWPPLLCFSPLGEDE